jgi:hypothetical protein
MTTKRGAEASMLAQEKSAITLRDRAWMKRTA